MQVEQTYSSAGINQVMESLEVSEMEGKYLSFWTDGQLFGVPIADVVQIVGVQEITVLPETPHYVKGIIDLRGSIIPVIDVRLRFSKPEKAYDERTCIIVTSIHEMLMGFVVDAVDEVSGIESDEILPPPQMNADYASSFLTGIAKREGKIILLINTMKLLGKDEAGELSQTILGGAAI